MGTNTQICNIEFLFVSETLHRLLGLALLLRQDHFPYSPVVENTRTRIEPALHQSILEYPSIVLSPATAKCNRPFPRHASQGLQSPESETEQETQPLPSNFLDYLKSNQLSIYKSESLSLAGAMCNKLLSQ